MRSLAAWPLLTFVSLPYLVLMDLNQVFNCVTVKGGSRLLAFSSKRLDFFPTSLNSGSPLSHKKGCSCTHSPNILSCSSERKTGDVFFLFLGGAPTSSVSSPSVIISTPSSSPFATYSSPSMKSPSSPRTTLGVSSSSEGANDGGECG